MLLQTHKRRDITVSIFEKYNSTMLTFFEKHKIATCGVQLTAVFMYAQSMTECSGTRRSPGPERLASSNSNSTHRLLTHCWILTKCLPHISQFFRTALWLRGLVMISFYKQENYVIKLPNDLAKGLRVKVYINHVCPTLESRFIT